MMNNHKKTLVTRYENRVVLFMDILGFKQLVSSTKKRDNGVQNVRNILNYIIRRIKKFPEHFPSAIISQFSDSFVISFKYGESGISLSLIETLQQLQKDLITKYKIIVRGGMTIGKLYHTEDYIFGPAMNEAYKLESEVAIYPRIILSEKLREHIADFPDEIFERYEEINESYIKNCLRRDSDNLFYIDYFKYNDIGDISKEEKKFVIALYDLISKNLKHYNEEKVLQKYKWMQEKYNFYATKLKNMKLTTTNVLGFSYSMGYDASKNKWYQSLKTI